MIKIKKEDRGKSGYQLCLPYHKEHLSLVVMRQQEKPRDCLVRDLKIRSFPIKLEESEYALIV